MGLVSIDAVLPNLGEVLRRVNAAGGAGGLPYTAEAVREATRDVMQRTWIEYASGAPVTWSGGTFRVNRVTGEYVRSIQDGLRFFGDMTGEVFTTSPHGQIVEEGQRARDMKEGLLSSPKAKKNKDGSRYITVAFRHGTPGTTTMPAMPSHVYSQAKKLGYSRVKEGLTTAGTRTYTWGGRYKDPAKDRNEQEGMRTHIPPHPGAGYQHKTGIYNSMVKMGRPGHSQYLTFRRVSDNSDPKSWRMPDVAPRPIREAVIENTKEEVLALIRRGFEMDLYFMGLGGGESGSS